MSDAPPWLRRFGVRGLFWRQYLDWAIINLPVYMQTFLLPLSTVFFFFFAAPTRRTIVANLSAVLPGSSPLSNHFRAFRTLYNFAWTIAEGATYKLFKTEFEYEIVGGEYLEQLGRARGAIVITAHMGNYDLGAALFTQKFGRNIRMVRAPEADSETTQHLTSSLERAGEGAVQVDYNTKGALLSFDLLHALRQDEIVSIQGDRLTGEVGETRAQLFDREVQLPTGPFILARVADVPLFPLFIARCGFRKYRIIVDPPITVARTGRNREADITAAVDQWCAVLQKVIGQNWDQWFAFTPIFSA